MIVNGVEYKMPDDILAERKAKAEWAKLQDSYTQAVSQITSFEMDPRVPAWLQTATDQFLREAKRLQKSVEAWQLVKKLQPAPVHHVPLTKGEPMETPHATFQRLVIEEIALAQGRNETLSYHEAATLINVRHPDLYGAAAMNTRPMDLPLPPAKPAMKSSTSTEIMLSLAKGKVLSGECASLDEAIMKVDKEHPELYGLHCKGL